MDSPCLEAFSGCRALWEIGFPTTCIETEMRTELVDKVPAQQGSCRACLLRRTSVVVPRGRGIYLPVFRHLGPLRELGE